MPMDEWDYSELLIASADLNTLNDRLIYCLKSLWLKNTPQELCATMALVEKIMASGACDLSGAVTISSLFASCVMCFRGQTSPTTPANKAIGMTRILHDLFEEHRASRVLVASMDDKFRIENCIECIAFTFTTCPPSSSNVDIFELQLSSFEMFLHLAGLTAQDMGQVFRAACLPLHFFPPNYNPVTWATAAILGLLDMLIDWGADNVKIQLRRCLLDASSLGSTGLVRILLTVAQIKNLDVDVNRALMNASFNSRFGTMEIIMEQGNDVNFAAPLVEAASRGCMPVVEWFVKRGCDHLFLSTALEFATCNSQIEVIAYLLPQVPHFYLSGVLQIGLGVDLGFGRHSLEGVAFLLCSDVLGDPAATYAAAEKIARSYDEENVAPVVRDFVQEHWSEEAFLDGIRQGEEHYMNIVRILKRGTSAMCFDLLPPDLRVAIAYLPLYKECVTAAGGCLVSQRLRGQLVDAVRRLGGGVLDGVGQCRELLAVLERRLSQFSHL